MATDILDEQTLDRQLFAEIPYDEFTGLNDLRFTKSSQCYSLEPVVPNADVTLAATRKHLVLYDVFTTGCVKRQFAPICFVKEKVGRTPETRTWIGGDEIQIGDISIDKFIKSQPNGYVYNRVIDGDGKVPNTEGSWYFLDWSFDSVRLYQLRHFTSSRVPTVELDYFELRSEENEYVD